MAQQKEEAVSRLEAAAQRVRALNERITEAAKQGGEASLDAYERLLKNVADFQESAGNRSSDWVLGFANAQARFVRDLAEALPSAARRLGGGASDAAGSAADQVRKVPGVPQAEGEVRGVGATESDLPIARYDSLSAQEIIQRLSRLSETELAEVDAYERKHGNRKTVRDRIVALQN
jgi:hypothetical protein